MSTHEKYINIGTNLMQKVFAKRGDHTEVHLGREELAALLALAAEMGGRSNIGNASLDEALNSGNGTYKP